MTSTGIHDASGNAKLLTALMVVAIVGAINWGLIGLFNWNLVDAILGGGAAETTSTGSRVVYTLVGLSGLIAATMMALRGRDMASKHTHRAT
jgi:uncharacterized membrane protein YuzA (DUF378 family)